MDFLQKTFSLIQIESLAEERLRQNILDIMTILNRYESIWVVRSESRTRKRLVDLIRHLGTVANPKLKACLASRIAVVFVAQKIEFNAVIRIIRIPKGYTFEKDQLSESDGVKEQVIKDRNFLKNRFADVIADVKLISKEVKIIDEFNQLMKTLKIKMSQSSEKDVFDELETLLQNIGETKPEVDLFNDYDDKSATAE